MLDPVLRVPDHGRLRPGHAAARLGRLLPEPSRGASSATARCCGRLSQLSRCRFIAILTGWFTAEVGPPALDGLRRSAHRRRDDAIPDGPRSRRSRSSSSAPSTASSSPSASSTSTGCCAPARSDSLVLPPAAAIPNRPMSVVDRATLAAPCTSLVAENSHGPVLGGRSLPSARCSTCCSMASISASASSSADAATRRAREHDERGGADLGRQRDLAGRRPAWCSGAPSRSSMRRCSPPSICRCSSCWRG